MADEETMTIEQTARFLGVSKRTVERYIEERSIPYTELPVRGARTPKRFLKSELLKWLQRRTVRAASWKGQSEDNAS